MARLTVLALAVLAAGCRAGDGAGPRTDGGAGDGGTDGQAAISGRVCLLADLRRLTAAAPGDCAAGAGGLRVSLGGAAPVFTSADGSFTIPAQAGSNLAWQVTAPDVVTSIVPVSAGAPLLPAIREVDYNDLLLGNGVVVAPDQGAIVARVLRGGAAAMNATAQVVGGESAGTLYDGNSATVWSTAATGALGVAWLPDNVAGARTLRISQGASQLSVPVAIAEQAITFVTIALP